MRKYWMSIFFATVSGASLAYLIDPTPDLGSFVFGIGTTVNLFGALIIYIKDLY